MIAVRGGGGVTDPNSNFKLRLIIEKARSYNMPKENIQRAIQRATGKQGEGLQTAVYEGFAPHGVSIIVEGATDNKNRLSSELKNIFEKNGGTLVQPGAVSYQFLQKGLVTISKNGVSSDAIFLSAAEAGAEDIEEEGDEVFVYTKPKDLILVKEILSKTYTVFDAELTRKPTITVVITDKEVRDKIITFVEKIESLDDVQKVYTNFDIQTS